MRYLKKYNEYNSSSNVIEDIKDILLELQDAGYSVEVYQNQMMFINGMRYLSVKN